MGIISFEFVSSKHLLPFTIGILTFIQKLIMRYGIRASFKPQENHTLFCLLLMFFAESFGLIGYYIIKAKESKNLNKEERTRKESAEVETLKAIFDNKLCKRRLIPYWIIIIETLIDLVGSLITIFLYIARGKAIGLITNGYEIGLCTIICYIAFKYEYHIHHAVGMGIITLMIITYSIYELLAQSNSQSFIIWLCLFLTASLRSFQFSLDKYLLTYCYVNPFCLIGLQGIFGLSVMLIILGVSKYIPCPEAYNEFCFRGVMDDFVESFKTLFLNWKIGLSYFGFICIVFVDNLFYALTNMLYNPTHLAIGITITSILYEFNNIGKEVFIDLIIFILCNIIILIGLLVFHEIIILHFWGLDHNIRSTIQERAIQEIKSLQDSLNNQLLEE